MVGEHHHRRHDHCRTDQGRGLRHEADEVARGLAEGLPESPVMPLDESVSIVGTIDVGLARSALGAPISGRACAQGNLFTVLYRRYSA